MLNDLKILGSIDVTLRTLLKYVDQVTWARLKDTATTSENWKEILSSAQFSPPIPVLLTGELLQNSSFTSNSQLSDTVPSAYAALTFAQSHVANIPIGQEIAIALEINEDCLRFIASIQPRQQNPIEDQTPLSSPIGKSPSIVARWFSIVSSQVIPEHDGNLTTARKAVDAFVQLSKSPNTLRAYRAAVSAWCQWASKHRLPALPARSEDVAAYLADMALRNRKTTTIDLHRAALRYLHHLAQVAVPTAHPLVGATLAGIRRETDDPLPHQKTALTWEKLTEVIATIKGTDPASLRDRAILLLGFAGAFRRSELAGLEMKDVTLDEDGMYIRLNRSKGDPYRKGAQIGIPRGITHNCPVKAYEKWVNAAGITEGAIFRRVWCPPLARGNSTALPPPKIGSTPLSDRAVADIIRKWCGVAGLHGDFSGHSLRRGAISTGAKDGYDLLELKRFSRHKSLQVVETYIDEASVKNRHPGRTRF